MWCLYNHYEKMFRAWENIYTCCVSKNIYTVLKNYIIITHTGNRKIFARFQNQRFVLGKIFTRVVWAKIFTNLLFMRKRSVLGKIFKQFKKSDNMVLFIWQIRKKNCYHKIKSRISFYSKISHLRKYLHTLHWKHSMCEAGM